MRIAKLPIVGVMGSGTDPHARLAQPLGRLLARLGVHLLTGGGQGVMATVSEAFATSPGRKGLVIGVVPCQNHDPLCQPKAGYPNPWVELPIRTHLPLSGLRGTNVGSRNHINILSSDAVVALPGSGGTSSEVQLAVRYRRPIIAFLGSHGRIPRLPKTVPTATLLEQVELFLHEALRSLPGPRPQPPELGCCGASATSRLERGIDASAE
jgi:uncharacterized protein (TIGR00725 family)